MQITIVAKARMKPGAKGRFLELARELVPASQAEAGCVCYNLYEDLSDPDVLSFIETWKDQAALDAHDGSPHFAAIVPQFPDLFDGAMEVTKYHKIL